MEIIEKIDKEIIHHSDNEYYISSKYRNIYIKNNGEAIKVKLPEKNIFKRVLGLFRITRRVFRLDKCNVFLEGENLIIIRQGKVYHYSLKDRTLRDTMVLRNCRNILHQSLSSTPDGYIYFGEYGNNGSRVDVPVYCSKDGGRSWKEIYTFPAKSIKHIHGCYYDKFTDRIWVCTGDFENENWIMSADRSFQDVVKYGDGSQRFRTCNLIFKEKEIHWLMDSQLEESYHIIFNRESTGIQIGQKFEGPIWYIKEIEDYGYLAASTQEIGAGVLDDKVHLYHSLDLSYWKSIKEFDHDGFPKGYFKFGVIGFAKGKQDKNSIYMFFEAVKGLDGKSLKVAIQ